MDKMREEYEAWFCSTMPYKIAKESWFAVMDDGDYIITDVQAGWAGWKASRAALPENHFPDAAEMVVPEGWQLVPATPTLEMILAGVAAQAEKLKRYALGGSLPPVDHGIPDAYQAMLSVAPTHEGGAS